MSRWETTSTLEAGVAPACRLAEGLRRRRRLAQVERRDQARQPRRRRWPLGTTAKIVFGTGLRLRFTSRVEFEDGRLLHRTIVRASAPGARMGHRHLIEPTD